MDNFIKNFRQNSIYLDLIATVKIGNYIFIILEDRAACFSLDKENGKKYSYHNSHTISTVGEYTKNMYLI